MNVKIQRSANGAILGAALWIPGEILEPQAQPRQEEIEVTFEGNIIKIGKATDAGRQPQAKSTLKEALNANYMLPA